MVLVRPASALTQWEGKPQLGHQSRTGANGRQMDATGSQEKLEWKRRKQGKACLASRMLLGQVQDQDFIESPQDTHHLSFSSAVESLSAPTQQMEGKTY